MKETELREDSLAIQDGSWFDSRSHSLRVGRSVTSIRLENAFWEALSAMAAEQSITINQLLAKIYTDTSDMNRAYNTASILRVLCIRWASDSNRKANRISDQRPSRFEYASDRQEIF